MNKITTGIVASIIGVSGMAAAAAPSLAAAASVNWGHTITGQQYGSTLVVSGTCATGAGCDRSKTFTGGIYGTTFSKAGSIASNAVGGYNASVKYTGPNGNTVTFANY